ncbi:MAG: transposase [Solirubrobacteraceae bacterium]
MTPTPPRSTYAADHRGRLSGLEPFQKFARMLEDHWLGVIRWHHSRVSNGLLEGLNSLIQAAKRRAGGTAPTATSSR